MEFYDHGYPKVDIPTPDIEIDQKTLQFIFKKRSKIHRAFLVVNTKLVRWKGIYDRSDGFC